ncbi:MAG: GIY-YIG nuclease family protein [Minisyncoccia bacterium]|jgi:excinuclease ABC subunit C
MNLKEKIKKMPSSPGVYMFLDENKKVLYVGRAASLKNRLLNYFQKNLDTRIQEMVSLAKDIKIKKTSNLLEAIFLESSLIKKFLPKYNIKDKDDKSAVYIVITEDEFPKILILRGSDLNKALVKDKNIFGPYKSLSIVKTALRLIRRIFPYSLCKPNIGYPCFDYQIGLCPGVCIGKISKEQYLKNIENIKLILQGKMKNLIKKLEKEKPEKAFALKHIQDVALIGKNEKNINSNFSRIEAYDISHFYGKGTYGSMVVFENNKIRKDQYRIFKIKEAPAHDDLRALKEVILRRLKHKEWKYPNLIVIDGGKPQLNFILKTFEENKIKIPVIGISKLAGDKIVFPPKIKKELKIAIESSKEILLQLRNEAHRFALKFNKKFLSKNLKSKLNKKLKITQR